MRIPSRLPGVIEATAAAVAQMNRYPDIANSEMTSALSSRLGVPASSSRSAPAQ